MRGRLTTRPSPAPSGPRLEARRQPLDIGGGPDVLVVPATGPDPAPLLVVLHGAGGTASGALDVVAGRPEAARVTLLGVSSAGRTWDVLLDDYGPDVETIDRAVAAVADRVAVDPTRLAIGGFSDGASYEL